MVAFSGHRFFVQPQAGDSNCPVLRDSVSLRQWRRPTRGLRGANSHLATGLRHGHVRRGPATCSIADQPCETANATSRITTVHRTGGSTFATAKSPRARRNRPSSLWRDHGLSDDAIAYRLNEQKVPTRTGRSWTDTAVKLILKHVAERLGE